MRRIFFALIALILSGNARAVSYADIWWNPNESGWGVTFSQQQATIFATFFIYGTDGKPYWVTAQLAGANSTATEFNGPVYTVTGSPYPQQFDASKTSVTQVGTARVVFSSGVKAALTYSINGTQISKSIERQTLSAIPLAGNYSGRTLYRDSLVSDISGVESITSDPTGYNVTVAGNSITVRRDSFPSNVCMFFGTFSQFGTRFSVSGTYQCSNFTAGNWLSTDLTVIDGKYLIATITSTRVTPTASGPFSEQWMGGKVGAVSN